MAALRLTARTSQHILCDLVDVLLAEGLVDVRPVRRPVPRLPVEDGEEAVRLEAASGRFVLTRVRRTWPGWRLSRPPVLAGGCAATAVEVAEHLLAGARWSGVGEVLTALRDAADHAAWAAATAPDREAEARHTPTLLAWERIAALGDRPFHPAAKARVGWGRGELERFAPEAARPVTLRWVAVRRDRVVSPTDTPPTEMLLTDEEHARVDKALAEAGPGEGYVALPVHPWQLTRLLTDRLGTDLADRAVVPLFVTTPGWWPTSSVRTLTRSPTGGLHVKLPLGIRTLGATRTLPARYLHNAAAAQGLLEAVAERCPDTTPQLVCDERSWWVVEPPDRDPVDNPGHLGCLVRRYPPAASRPGITAMPLGALAHVGRDGFAPALEHLLGSGGVTPVRALGLLSAVTRAVASLAVRSWACGVMPELHGQNLVLLFAGHQVTATVLRDHDAVRIHPPWLVRAGLPVPSYLVSKTTPNTLVAGDPAELLGWFQTLGLQVAIRAIGDTLVTVLPVGLRQVRAAVRTAVRDAIAAADLSSSTARLAEELLFGRVTWPVKQILRPWLERSGAGPSMPSAMGRAPNPLRAAAGVR